MTSMLLVRRDRRDVVVDQVLPRPDHDVAVGVERLVERRRVVALDPVDDRRLRRRVGSISRAAATRAALCSPAAAQPIARIVVGVEAVEGAQADQLVVALAAERPVVDGVGERAPQPRRVLLDGGLRAPPRPASSRRWSAAGWLPVPAATISSNRLGSASADSSSSFCHRPTWGRRPASGCWSRNAGTASRRPVDRGQPLGQRREVAREEQEQGVAERVHRGRAALPGPDDLGVEEATAEVVDLELALERGLRRQAGRVDGLDGREVGALVGGFLEHLRRAFRRPGGRPPCGCRGTSPTIGLSRTSRRKRASTRS